MKKDMEGFSLKIPFISNVMNGISEKEKRL